MIGSLWVAVALQLKDDLYGAVERYDAVEDWRPRHTPPFTCGVRPGGGGEMLTDQIRPNKIHLQSITGLQLNSSACYTKATCSFTLCHPELHLNSGVVTWLYPIKTSHQNVLQEEEWEAFCSKTTNIYHVTRDKWIKVIVWRIFI